MDMTQKAGMKLRIRKNSTEFFCGCLLVKFVLVRAEEKKYSCDAQGMHKVVGYLTITILRYE